MSVWRRRQLQLRRRFPMHRHHDATVTRLHQRGVLLERLERGMAVDLLVGRCIGIQTDHVTRVQSMILLNRQHLRRLLKLLD